MKISVIITLKKDVLDPQGKVIHQTLSGMGFEGINEVRQENILKLIQTKVIRKKLKKKLKRCVRNF